MAGRCSKFLRSWLMVFFAAWLALMVSRYATQNLHILSQGILEHPKVETASGSVRHCQKICSKAWSGGGCAIFVVSSAGHLGGVISGGCNEKSVGRSIPMDEKVAIFCLRLSNMSGSFSTLITMALSWLHMVIWLSGRLHGRTASLWSQNLIAFWADRGLGEL